MWLTVDAPELRALQVAAVFAFVALAFGFWALWMPLSLLHREPDPRRRVWLRRLAGVGVVVATSVGVYLFMVQPLASVDGHSIRYHMPAPQLAALAFGVAYGLACIGPFFVSSEPWARTMGFTLFVALVMSSIFWSVTYPSVWCFFAALGSVIVAVGMSDLTWPALHHHRPHSRIFRRTQV